MNKKLQKISVVLYSCFAGSSAFCMVNHEIINMANCFEFLKEKETMANCINYFIESKIETFECDHLKHNIYMDICQHKYDSFINNLTTNEQIELFDLILDLQNKVGLGISNRQTPIYSAEQPQKLCKGYKKRIKFHYY